MKFMIKLLSILFLLTNSVNAQTINLNLAKARISLLDLGSLINKEALIVDKELVRVYNLSGLDDEKQKSIIALQGLKDHGETDITISTRAGLKQIHIKLNKEYGEDLVLNPQYSRSKIIKDVYHLDKERSTIISCPQHINEYVLAGDPELISTRQILDFYDPNFLKDFALVSGNNPGITDIVVPCQDKVYKFTVKIGDKNASHTNNIVLH